MSSSFTYSVPLVQFTLVNFYSLASLFFNGIPFFPLKLCTTHSSPSQPQPLLAFRLSTLQFGNRNSDNLSFTLTHSHSHSHSHAIKLSLTSALVTLRHMQTERKNEVLLFVASDQQYQRALERERRNEAHKESRKF
jgi:hypothetical protein